MTLIAETCGTSVILNGHFTIFSLSLYIYRHHIIHISSVIHLSRELDRLQVSLISNSALFKPDRVILSKLLRKSHYPLAGQGLLTSQTTDLVQRYTCTFLGHQLNLFQATGAHGYRKIIPPQDM